MITTKNNYSGAAFDYGNEGLSSNYGFSVYLFAVRPVTLLKLK